MRDIISRVLEGNYIQSSGILNCSASKVEIAVSCDCDYEGSFRIFTSDGSVLESRIISSDARMEVLSPEVAGTESDISYHFHGDLCKPGDEIKGGFSVISDHGELNIPFIVKIEPGELLSSAGQIRNLFNFVNLARTNWDEALELFYSPDFKGILSGSDEYYMGMYLALSAIPGNSQNLEEFLLSSGKKPKAQYFYDKKIFETSLIGVEYSENLVEREIEIVRNGWSYVDLQIEVEGDFIVMRRDVLSENDFTGNICTLNIFIDPSKCRKGRREGRIVLRNNFAYLEIPIVVKGRAEIINNKVVRSRAIILESLTGAFIRHGLGLEEDKEWFEETTGIVEQYSAICGKDVYANLFKARLLCIEGRNNEAGWLVDQAADIIETAEKYGELCGNKLLEAYAYHWLTASIVNQDENFTKMAAQKVESLVRKAPGDWKIGAIALMLPTTHNATPFTRWNLCQDLYEAGGRSGIIYYEAIKALNELPTVSKYMDGFMIQTVYFGCKYKVVNEKTLEQVLALSPRVRKTNYIHLHMLELLYEQFDDNRILQELCSQLISANKVDKSAHKWYRLAIDKEIKLTGLFEYFIQSMDLTEEEDIPLLVLMYFGYQNHLESDRLAYMYYYIIRNKSLYSDLYEASLTGMEFFASGQIAKGKINKHLAAIYADVFDPAVLSRQQALGISNILFSKWIVCEKKDCVKAFVYQKGCQYPYEYDLVNGEGAICGYGSGYIVVFEDAEGNRYIGSVKFTSEELMPVSKFLPAIIGLVWDNERLNFYVVGTGKTAVTVTSSNVSRFMQLGESENVRPYVRRNRLTLAMEYYSNHDDENSFSRCLRMLGTENLTAEQRGRLFPLLYRFGYDEEVKDWLIRFGPYFTSRANIKRYLDRELKPFNADPEAPQPDGGVFKRALIEAAIYVFREGNPGTVIAQFLGDNFEGSTKELVEVWKVVKNYGLPTGNIVRRIMTQHMYTDVYISDLNEIARDCVEDDPSSDIARAIVSQGSYNYFIGKGVPTKEITTNIIQMVNRGVEITRPSKLAFLKYFADFPDQLDEEAGEIAIAFLKDMIGSRIYLGFFKSYLNIGMFKNSDQKNMCEKVLDEIRDRTIIDYKVTRGKSAKIHYVIVSEGTENFDYSSETMKEVCGGVCFKDFILFFGETLQYYITEETEEEAALSDSGQVSSTDTDGHGRINRYALINDMLISNTTKDYIRFDKQYEDFLQREYMNEQLFRLL